MKTIYLVNLTSDKINMQLISRLEMLMGRMHSVVHPTLKVIYEAMNEADSADIKVEGVNKLLKYPEYSDTQQFGQLLGTLENQDEILDLVSQSENDDINVLIGSESPVKVMNNSALVFKPIKKNGHTVGVIGILGPRRMNYRQVLQTIDEISGSISGMINEEPKAIDTSKGEHHGG